MLPKLSSADCGTYLRVSSHLTLQASLGRSEIYLRPNAHICYQSYWGYPQLVIGKAIWAVFSNLPRMMWDGIKGLAVMVWNGLAALPGLIWDGLVAVFVDLPNWLGGKIMEGLMAVFNDLPGWLQNTLKFIGNVFLGVFNIIKKVAEILYFIGAIILWPFIKVMQGLWWVIKKVAGIIASIFMPIAEAVGDFFVGLGQLWTDFMEGLGKAWDGFLELIKPVTDAVSAFFTGVGEAWDGLMAALEPAFAFFRACGEIVEKTIDGIHGAFKWLYDVLYGHSIIPDLVEGIIKFFMMLPIRILSGLVNFGLDMLKMIGEWIGGIPGMIISNLADIGKWLWNSFVEALEGIGNWLYDTFISPFVNIGTTIFNMIVDGLKGLGEAIMNLIPGLRGAVQGFTETREEAAATREKEGDSAAHGLGNTAGGAWQMMSLKPSNWVEGGGRILDGLGETASAVGSSIGSFFSSINPFALGTQQIEQPGLGLLHAGEAVIPAPIWQQMQSMIAEGNPFGSGGGILSSIGSMFGLGGGAGTPSVTTGGGILGSLASSVGSFFGMSTPAPESTAPAPSGGLFGGLFSKIGQALGLTQPEPVKPPPAQKTPLEHLEAITKFLWDKLPEMFTNLLDGMKKMSFELISPDVSAELAVEADEEATDFDVFDGLLDALDELNDNLGLLLTGGIGLDSELNDVSVFNDLTEVTESVDAEMSKLVMTTSYFAEPAPQPTWLDQVLGMFGYEQEPAPQPTWLDSVLGAFGFEQQPAPQPSWLDSIIGFNPFNPVSNLASPAGNLSPTAMMTKTTNLDISSLAGYLKDLVGMKLESRPTQTPMMGMLESFNPMSWFGRRETAQPQAPAGNLVNTVTDLVSGGSLFDSVTGLFGVRREQPAAPESEPERPSVFGGLMRSVGSLFGATPSRPAEQASPVQETGGFGGFLRRITGGADSLLGTNFTKLLPQQPIPQIITKVVTPPVAVPQIMNDAMQTVADNVAELVADDSTNEILTSIEDELCEIRSVLADPANLGAFADDQIIEAQMFASENMIEVMNNTGLGTEGVENVLSEDMLEDWMGSMNEAIEDIDVLQQVLTPTQRAIENEQGALDEVTRAIDDLTDTFKVSQDVSDLTDMFQVSQDVGKFALDELEVPEQDICVYVEGEEDESGGFDGDLNDIFDVMNENVYVADDYLEIVVDLLEGLLKFVTTGDLFTIDGQVDIPDPEEFLGMMSKNTFGMNMTDFNAFMDDLPQDQQDAIMGALKPFEVDRKKLGGAAAANMGAFDPGAVQDAFMQVADVTERELLLGLGAGEPEALVREFGREEPEEQVLAALDENGPLEVLVVNGGKPTVESASIGQFGGLERVFSSFAGNNLTSLVSSGINTLSSIFDSSEESSSTFSEAGGGVLSTLDRFVSSFSGSNNTVSSMMQNLGLFSTSQVEDARENADTNTISSMFSSITDSVMASPLTQALTSALGGREEETTSRTTGSSMLSMGLFDPGNISNLASSYIESFTNAYSSNNSSETSNVLSRFFGRGDINSAFDSIASSIGSSIMGTSNVTRSLYVTEGEEYGGSLVSKVMSYFDNREENADKKGSASTSNAFSYNEEGGIGGGIISSLSNAFSSSFMPKGSATTSMFTPDTVEENVAQQVYGSKPQGATSLLPGMDGILNYLSGDHDKKMEELVEVMTLLKDHLMKSGPSEILLADNTKGIPSTDKSGIRNWAKGRISGQWMGDQDNAYQDQQNAGGDGMT
jgi:hypothetical protein